MGRDGWVVSEWGGAHHLLGHQGLPVGIVVPVFANHGRGVVLVVPDHHRLVHLPKNEAVLLLVESCVILLLRPQMLLNAFPPAVDDLDDRRLPMEGVTRSECLVGIERRVTPLPCLRLDQRLRLREVLLHLALVKTGVC